MIKKIVYGIVVLICISSCTPLRKIPLSPKLVESSALIKHQDVFLTINDSDNAPIVFVFNEKGEVVHECHIKNVKNNDWEALAYDGGDYLFIGDIGNNNNNRKNLAILKVKMSDVLEKDSVEVEMISYRYSDQTTFPPSKELLYYDAEAMIIKDNEILIFTKNRTVPFDGISKVYRLPNQPGNHVAQFLYNIQLPSTHWIEESITDAYYFEGELYLLTYSKIYKYVWQDEIWIQKEEKLHTSITQKEGIAVDKKWIYITDEDNSNFFNGKKGNYLYRIIK